MAFLVGAPIHRSRVVDINLRRDRIGRILRTNVVPHRLGPIGFIAKDIAPLNIDLAADERILRKKRFSQAQNFSMELSLGEYGGRKISLQPAFWATKISRFLEWKEALSTTITVPFPRREEVFLRTKIQKVYCPW